jgi:hypothetical protein
VHENRTACEQHIVVLDNLSASATYYCEIVSNGVADDNKGNCYSFRTTEPGAGVPFTIFGCVVNAGEQSPASQTIVAATLRRGDIVSHPLITVTGSEGMWLLNLGNLKESESGSVLPYQVGDTVLLEFSGNGAVGVDTIAVFESSPQNCGVSEIEAVAACGDIDGSGDVSIDDIVALLYYVFGSDERTGAFPVSAGDVDCSSQVDVDDIVYLIEFVFGGGPPPCEGC